jgi:hypothetical protein
MSMYMPERFDESGLLVGLTSQDLLERVEKECSDHSTPAIGGIDRCACNVSKARKGRELLPRECLRV